MCGICGIVNFNNKPAEESDIRMMMSKIRHRGPNDNGIYINNNIGLGFLRLSIIDLSNLGHQPMFDVSKRYVIIFNGEVYNFIEIKNELVKKGYKFISNTDTEVILYSFIEWGEDCLHKFNGMWAFCIYDTYLKQLFISRDRYGVKPFYYYIDKEKILFASEIPAILAVLGKVSANNQSVFDYLIFNRTDQTEDTFFAGIKKLQHGHSILLKPDSTVGNSNAEAFKINRWYNLRDKVDSAIPFSDPSEFREIFSSAVGLRLRSDVPVGVCLSGGLDSSSIVSVLLKDFNKVDLNTFSAIYDDGQCGNESEFINLYKDQLCNMYYTSPNHYSLYDDLKRFIIAHSEPIPSTSPYAQFKVMELAKDHVVVTLDGQGADEALAGYHYFYGFLFKDLLRQGDYSKLISEIFQYLKLHSSLYGLKTFLYFLLPKNLKTELRIREKKYLTKEFQEAYSGNNKIAGDLYASSNLNEALLNHFEYKLEHLLKWEDRNSMHFSLEARVPFLDYRIVERTLAMESINFIQNGWTKHLLREAMRNTLPEKIRLRKDKIGFDTPQAEWFRENKFNSLVKEILNSESFNSRNIIDKNIASGLFEKYNNSKLDISKEIWKWINLELWYREFID